MIVISDTSPLSFLIQLSYENLLQELYQRVLIPRAVFEELNRAGAPAVVRDKIASVPDWLRISTGASPPDQTLAYLDWGEREAIQLCEEQHGSLLIIDDRRGRKEAKRRGLVTIGTLGILAEAGEIGLIDLPAAYKRLLSETDFRISTALKSRFQEKFRPPS